MTAEQARIHIGELLDCEESNGYRTEHLVREWCNAKDVELTSNGDIWVSDPMAGHWLSDAKLIEFVEWEMRKYDERRIPS